MPRQQHVASWQHRSGPRDAALRSGISGSYARSFEELEGTWMNMDCPREQYIIRGRRITRSDARGTREFTLHWDRNRRQWRWGTHGRLSLQWLGGDSIAWIPDSGWDADQMRGWRWERYRQVSQVIAQEEDEEDSGYRPWRRARNRQRTQEPYPRRPRHGSNRASEEPCEDWHSSRSRRYNNGGRDSRRHGHYRGHHRSRHRDYHRHRSSHSARRRYRHSGQSLRRGDRSLSRFHVAVGDMQANAVMPCGLTASEVYSLLSREIIPEDYELLLRLDESLPKRTVSVERFRSLLPVACHEFNGGKCSVCLAGFEHQDVVVALPCEHQFHRSCITTWLSEYRRTCPLCCAEALPTEQGC